MNDSTILWSVLATGIAVFHWGYLGYQLFGGLLGLVDRRWLIPHVASLSWAVVVVAMGWKCPLTSLEKWLIARSGETPYSGSFLDHYVYGTVLPEGSQSVAYASYLTLAVLIYAWLPARKVLASRRVTA